MREGHWRLEGEAGGEMRRLAVGRWGICVQKDCCLKGLHENQLLSHGARGS